MPDLLRPEDAATFLQVSRRTMDNWRWSGKGPIFIRVGGQVRYRQADLEAYVAEGQVTAK